MAPPPAPEPLPAAEKAQLSAAQRRLPRKWATLDHLLADFEAADVTLRLTRR